MCNEREHRPDPIYKIFGLVGTSWRVIESWYSGNLLRKRTEFRDAEIATLSRHLPRKVELLSVINDDPRGGNMPNHMDLITIEGTIAYRPGEVLRLSSSTASKIYTKNVGSTL